MTIKDHIQGNANLLLWLFACARLTLSYIPIIRGHAAFYRGLKMSVICKVTVSEVRDFGGAHLIKTQCVAENEVMAHYNPDAEDKLFSQYSPSGSADFVVPANVAIPQTKVWGADKLYLMFIENDEEP